jgi:hypothetical protein
MDVAVGLVEIPLLDTKVNLTFTIILLSGKLLYTFNSATSSCPAGRSVLVGRNRGSTGITPDHLTVSKPVCATTRFRLASLW